MIARPARLEDPLLYDHLNRLDAVTMNAYLVALAAWQRGLEVVFHYELVSKCERFSRLPVQGCRGELFSVSDGQHTHYFCRALGDRTTREASAMCEDKQAAKAHLRKHGIEVPAGCVIDARAGQHAKAFLQRHPRQRFLVKPLKGTLGKGVQRKLSAQGVLALLPALQGEHLLETHIDGPEYRVHVVAGRCIASLLRTVASVVGDGWQTLAALIEQQRQQRAAHAVYRLAPLPDESAIQAFLTARGQTLDEVPALGQSVALSAIPSFADGGGLFDVTTTLPAQVTDVAIRTQQALGLPNTGIDLIVEHPGQPNERVVVLEANQNPHIYTDALPFPGVHTGGGNRIAEAIIDAYFPASLNRPRYPRASFDMQAVVQALQSATLGEIALPVLAPTWQHQRLTLAASQANETTRSQVRRLMFALGVNGQLWVDDKGQCLIDVVAPAPRVKLFLEYLQGRRRQ